MIFGCGLGQIHTLKFLYPNIFHLMPLIYSLKSESESFGSYQSSVRRRRANFKRAQPGALRAQRLRGVQVRNFKTKLHQARPDGAAVRFCHLKIFFVDPYDIFTNVFKRKNILRGGLCFHFRHVIVFLLNNNIFVSLSIKQ